MMEGKLVLRDGKMFVLHEYTMQDTPEARRLYWAVQHTKRNPYSLNSPEAGDTVASTGEGWWIVTNRSGAGEVWTGSGGDPAAYDEIVPVPPPKVRKGVELRWYYGEWQKLLKTRWVPAGMGKMPAAGGKRRSPRISPKTSRALLQGMQLTNVTARFAPGGKRKHAPQRKRHRVAKPRQARAVLSSREIMSLPPHLARYFR